jgi:hypothetical protein
MYLTLASAIDEADTARGGTERDTLGAATDYPCCVESDEGYLALDRG